MATHFEIDHVLPCPPEVFWSQIHNNEAFYHALYREHLGFDFAIEARDEATGACRTKMIPKIPAPDVVLRALGAKSAEDFAMTEDGRWNPERKRYEFRILTSLMPERVDVRGVMELRPAPEGKCVRHMEFDLDVKLFGVGKIVEAFVERSVRQSYDQSGAFTAQYLEKKRAEGAF